jgi:hypothetical protein
MQCDHRRAFGLVIAFVGHSDIARDYTLHKHASVHSHVFTIRCTLPEEGEGLTGTVFLHHSLQILNLLTYITLIPSSGS